MGWGWVYRGGLSKENITHYLQKGAIEKRGGGPCCKHRLSVKHINKNQKLNGRLEKMEDFFFFFRKIKINKFGNKTKVFPSHPILVSALSFLPLFTSFHTHTKHVNETTSSSCFYRNITNYFHIISRSLIDQLRTLKQK